MKNLKLLNKKSLLFVLSFFLFFSFKVYSEEPVDIWNIEKKEPLNETETGDDLEEQSISGNSIFEMQSHKKNVSEIEQDETLLSKKINVVGLYDPEENDLTMDMWSNSDGKEILNLLNKIRKTDLSDDAKEILNISLLTNAYFPEKNISSEKFLNFILNWLIKYSDLELIENYVIKNKNINEISKLIRFFVDEHLSNSELEKSCSIFSKINIVINDNYLSKFNIYCLINSDNKEQAQLQLDLNKELGFKDGFFEEKFNYLMGYNTEIENTISSTSILDFHLSHRTNPDFKYEPDKSTPKFIWRYLSSSNLLENLKNVDLENQDKLSIIEKATHEKNYDEKELYELYKRFQFNINQLLSVRESYKLLSNIEARALVYQGILITTEVETKLEMIKILKGLFVKDGIGNAFKNELAEILQEINVEDVPSNYTTFYKDFVNEKKANLIKTKINNKIIHQSKLLNYFRTDIAKKSIEKDLNDLLKKTKKNKNYFISTKDKILIESLKYDGIKVLKKYDDMYEVDNYNMPEDIQTLIDNDEMGLVLLRLVEVIGQDDLQDIGSETLYFVITALNQLNIDALRNKILLKVLPLKV